MKSSTKSRERGQRGSNEHQALSLSEEVYARLDAERGVGESFDDVIIRLTEKRSLMNIVGFLKERDAEEMRKVIDEMREKSRDRIMNSM